MSALEVKFPRSLLLAQLMRHQCIDFYFFFVACRLLLHVEGLDNLAKIKKKKKKFVEYKVSSLLNFLLLQPLLFSGYLCVCNINNTMNKFIYVFIQ